VARLETAVSGPDADPDADADTDTDAGPDFDVDGLTAALAATFGGTAGGRAVVARQARDLADAGLLERDRGDPLTPDVVVAELADAPDDCEDVPSRWNWWLGAMAVAYGDYEQFQVRRYRRDGDRGRERE
jgi:hypothetical protein